MLAMFTGAQVVHQYYLPDLVSEKGTFIVIHNLSVDKMISVSKVCDYDDEVLLS